MTSGSANGENRFSSASFTPNGTTLSKFVISVELSDRGGLPAADRAVYAEASDRSRVTQ